MGDNAALLSRIAFLEGAISTLIKRVDALEFLEGDVRRLGYKVEDLNTEVDGVRTELREARKES